MKKSLLPLLLLCVALCSCKSNKDNLTYFRNNLPTANQVITPANYRIRIEPGDRITVVVSSDMSSVSNLYNLPNNENESRSYLVDSQGDIIMPKLGKVHVAGLTTAQVAEDVTRRLAEYIEAPLVRVELVNFKVNVLGEVKSPQLLNVPQERFTILDAIAACGDLTVFGKRENVTLIREEDGRITYNQVDLSDANLVSSPYYYLRQNDVIYVEPTEVRKAQAEYSVNDSYKIQVVSAVVSGASVIVSLIIALAVK